MFFTTSWHRSCRTQRRSSPKNTAVVLPEKGATYLGTVMDARIGSQKPGTLAASESLVFLSWFFWFPLFLFAPAPC